MENQIIKSMLDLDRYKLTMAHAAWRKYRDVYVMYSFKNRTNIRLADYIDEGELRAQIYALSRLKFTEDELNYLSTWGPSIMPILFINFLRETVGKQDIRFSVEKTKDGQFDICFEGRWCHAILYETMILSIVNELFARKIMTGMTKNAIDTMYNEGIQFHESKMKLIDKVQAPYTEFGTRRRHSLEWQTKILEVCIDRKQEWFTGTSNCFLAKKFNIPCKGTIAHEWFMVNAALDYTKYNQGQMTLEDFRNTQYRALESWTGIYSNSLSIILTDTFGTNDFFRIFDKKMADYCYGLRQDSGDPFEFAYRAIGHYKDLGINPLDKTIMFSDGLDAKLIYKLQLEFKNQVKTTYGWGTSLTNDLWIKPLSIVVKATYANDQATVKLSDNTAKAMGPTDLVEFYKNTFLPKAEYVPTKY